MSNPYQRFENDGEAEANKPPPYAPPPPGFEQTQQMGYPAAGQAGYPAAPATQQGYPAAPPPQQGYPAAQYPQPGTVPQQGYPQGPGNQQGYPGPPPAYPAGSQPATQPGQPPVVLRENTVIVAAVGNCPNCRAGNMKETINACAIVLAIVFFPIGLLFLLCMTDKRCDRCGYTM